MIHLKNKRDPNSNLTEKYCSKAILGKNHKEKNMRTKNKTLAIAGIEPPISSMLDRTQRPRQTRHWHSLKYKCRKSKYIVVTCINKTTAHI
jgi:hypothetical protein